MTLSSDFGLQDAYVAQMKGVLLSEGPPELRLHDLSHELPRGDLIAAALFVEAAVPRFPDGTVHLLVVDPGVGSDRRLLIAHLGDSGQRVVAPDNGLLEPLLAGARDVTLTAIDTTGPTHRSGRGLSHTFHGRDLMAPVAARLAWGMDPQALGTAVDDPVRLGLPTAKTKGAVTHGEVLHVDRFGNLITNVLASSLPEAGPDRALQATLAGHTVGPLRTHYAQVAPGELLLLCDSGGRLEIAVRDGSAAAHLEAERHVEVSVEMVEMVEQGQ